MKNILSLLIIFAAALSIKAQTLEFVVPKMVDPPSEEYELLIKAKQPLFKATEMEDFTGNIDFHGWTPLEADANVYHEGKLLETIHFSEFNHINQWWFKKRMTLKSGDEILVDNIRMTLPDGTEELGGGFSFRVK